MNQVGRTPDTERAIASKDAAQSLITWFWKYGHKRSGRYRLPTTWIFDAYKHLDVSQAIVDSLARSKPTLALWGPSRSGKSTLLSDFIDSPNSPDSALRWDKNPVRFLRSEKFEAVDALNPLNARGDASACVSRFYAAEEVPHTAHPAQIDFASRRQTLQALAAGYVMECKLRRPRAAERDWDPEQIHGLLTGGKASIPNQDAVELLLDIVSVIDRLIEDEHPRYSKLRGADNDWERTLRTAVLSDPDRISSVLHAEALGFELLWDGRQKLTELFKELEAYRVKLEKLFGTRPKFVSLKLASLILDIDSYPVVMRRENYDERRANELERLISQTRYQLHDDHVLIDTEGTGGIQLFNSKEDFGLFQAIVWELVVPLQKKFLKERSKRAANFLERYDVLDVPGVARQYQKASSEKLDLEDPNVTKAELLVQIIKRGKTATIINRYAEQMRIDAMLILVGAGENPAQPPQLIGGVNSIWRAYDPTYSPNRGRPPVPVAVCLTFMAGIVDEMAAAGAEHFDLASFDTMISQLGPIVHPNVCNIFATSYPHLPAGTFKTPLEQRRTKILPAILSMKWFQERFRTPTERASIAALLQDDDGGVGALLDALASLPHEQRASRLSMRLKTIIEGTESGIRRALPERDLDSERYRQAVEKLVTLIEARAKKTAAKADDVAQLLSSQLRRAFAFRAEDFQFYPKNVGGVVDDIADYVDKQLDNWVERQEARLALTQLGLNEDEQTVILDAVRKTVNAHNVASWCVNTFGPVTDDYRAGHVRRYVAAKCAHYALGAQGQAKTDIVVGDFNVHCVAKYKEWSVPNRPVTSSPHYEAAVAPMLARFRQIAQSNLATRWDDQVGDTEIEGIAQTWRTGGSDR